MRALASLHGRLAVALLLTLGTLWAGAVAHARLGAAAAAADDVDERLGSTVSRLFQLVVLPGDGLVPSGGAPSGDASLERLLPPAPPPPPPPPTGGPARPGPAREPSFEIVWEDGRVPVRSTDFPRGVGSTPDGFHERRSGARSYRVLTVVDPERRVVGRAALDDLARESLARERDREAVRPLLWVLPLLAVGALGSLWYGLAPLRALERAVARQAPDEPRGLGLDPARMPRELGRLTATVETLLARLRDVLERRRAFAAAAGHELRTPLAGCGIQLQVARRTDDAAVRDRALDQARTAIDAMDRLVDRLLLLGRADARVPGPPKARVDLGRIVAGAVAAHGAVADGRDVWLRESIDPRGAIVLGDATLLDSLVGNLLDNALKFAPAGTTVDVGLEADAERATLRVRDRGPGIPEDERARVFEPFHRGAAAPRPGSGIGLATVRAIAADHGGEARLDAPPGGGTEAVVTLPMD